MSALQVIARSISATRVLEIGTGSGDATLQLASALPRDGMLITMEAGVSVAAQARERFAAAGMADRVSVIAGEPARFLHKVRGPFDLVFHNGGDVEVFRDRLLALLRSGGVLISANPKYSGEEGGDAALRIMVKDMTIAEWLAAAKADAEKRGLPELIPMLEGLAQASQRLRAADWNDDPSTPLTNAAAIANLAQGGRRDDDQ
jgi:predicted O-methyltransferase YrrM